MNLSGIFINTFIGAGAILSLSSCVYEYPDINNCPTDLTLNIRCENEWLPELSLNNTRAENYGLKYIFRFYPEGNHDKLIKEISVVENDLSRENFSIPVSLIPGNYDLFVWADFCDFSTGESLFYDTQNFSSINILQPYIGDTDLKDAFRGMASFRIEGSKEYQPPQEVAVNLSRPLARYIFVATDLQEFFMKENARIKAESKNASSNFINDTELLNSYDVKIIYSGYLPSVFDNFSDNPVFSESGITFSGKLEKLTDGEAQVAMDFVMVNGEDSSIKVMIEISDDSGNVVSRFPSMDVPTERNRTTIVYGKYLTTMANSGVGIDPDFDGDFNIEIK